MKPKRAKVVRAWAVIGRLTGRIYEVDLTRAKTRQKKHGNHPFKYCRIARVEIKEIKR